MDGPARRSLRSNGPIPPPQPRRGPPRPRSELVPYHGTRKVGMRSETSVHIRATVSPCWCWRSGRGARACRRPGRSRALGAGSVWPRGPGTHQKVGEQGVLGHVVEHPVAGQVAQATEYLVTGVEQTELHHLVGLDVRPRPARRRPRTGPADRETVLETHCEKVRRRPANRRLCRTAR